MISLDPDGSMWLRSNSGEAVQYQRVSMPRHSNLSELQGSWVHCNAKRGTTVTLVIEGATWHATIRRCTTRGLLRLENRAVLINGTTVNLSSRGQIQLKDLCFKRISYSGSLFSIGE